MPDPITFELTAGRLVLSFRRTRRSGIFIVHGHDHDARNDLAQFLRALGLNPIVLDQEPNEGNTVIEKFERQTRRASVAIGLLTRDDVGYPKGLPEKATPRARQNVVFELGFFIGKLGRRKVIAIRDHDVEIPSDYQGVVYIIRDAGVDWRLRLIQELEAVGVHVKDAWRALLERNTTGVIS
jgi:predicted nucleotide-binding protein